MRDLNSVCLFGRLTANAELKQFENGGNIISFSIAVNTSYKKEGEWIDYPNFFNVKYSGKNLANLNQYLTKGQAVVISGHLKQDRWEKDGKKNSAVIIEAEQVQLVGNKKDSGGGSQPSQSTEEPFPEDFNF